MMKALKPAPMALAALLVAAWLDPAASNAFTRYVTREFRMAHWFLANPTSPAQRPLVDLNGDGSLYAVEYTFAGSGASDLSDTDAELEAIRDAFAAYQGVPHSFLEFREDPDRGTALRLGADGKNLVFWDSTGVSQSGGDIPDDEIAVTVLTLNPSTGEILESDIRFNDQDYDWTVDGSDPGAVDVFGAALHEIGVMIGLDSSFIDTAAVDDASNRRPAMYPLEANGPLRPGLTQDDRSGVARIYPEPSFFEDYGQISGTIRSADGQQGLYGAHVVALDADTGDPVLSAVAGSGALADDPDGSFVNPNSGHYTLYGVPPGTYLIAVHPLENGFASPNKLRSAYRSFNPFRTGFPYEFYNEEDDGFDRPGERTEIEVDGGDRLSGIDVIANQRNRIQLTDNDSRAIDLAGFQFPFFGRLYGRVYAHADGFVTMGIPDPDPSETSIEFFEGPAKVAALWDDFNPEVNGASVYAIQSPEFVEIVYMGFPESPSRGASSFAVRLFATGKVEIEYFAVSSVDDGIVGISPGTATPNTELNFSGIADEVSVMSAVPVFERFTGSGDDPDDTGGGDVFDLDGRILVFTPNLSNGYDVSIRNPEDAPPTPTRTPTLTATPTPSPTPVNQAPIVTLNPGLAILQTGGSVIVDVTAVDPEGALVSFADDPPGSGEFGSVNAPGGGVFTTTYRYQALPGSAGVNEVAILAADGQRIGAATLTLFVDIEPTPTPTFTLTPTATSTFTPTPTATQTFTETPTPTDTPNLNRPPSLTLNPSTLSMIAGETKSTALFASDPDGEALTFAVFPVNAGTLKNITRVGNIYTGQFEYASAAGQEGVFFVTITASDGFAEVSREIAINVFPEGVTPTNTPTATPTPTVTRTPTVTPTFTGTPVPSPTVNAPPVLTVSPDNAAVKEGESVLISVSAGDPNQDTITFQLDDPRRILERQTFFRSNLRVDATYLFTGNLAKAGLNRATFTVTDGFETVTKIFEGLITAISTPTPTPVPQGDIVVAQGLGGETFVNRRSVPGVLIAPGSAYSAMPGTFAAAINSSPTREVYVAMGDVDGDGSIDIVNSFGPFAPPLNGFPSQILVRDAATRRVIGHSFNAFPHASELPVNNPFGEVRVAVGRFIPGRERTQLAAAHGAGGNNVIRVYEFTGNPPPRGFEVVAQFQGLVGEPANLNQSGALSVASGDLTGDGIDELVVGQTNGNLSTAIVQVLQFDENARVLRSQPVAAFPARFKGLGGVNLAVGDVDGDGVNEIVAASMGHPEGALVGETVFKNLVNILRAETREIFDLVTVESLTPVQNGIFNVFSNEENPSGAVSVAAGDLVPGGGDELVFGTAPVVTVDPFTRRIAVSHRPELPRARALRLTFNEEGRRTGFESIIANRSGVFQVFVPENEADSRGVNVGIREFRPVSP